MLDDPTFVVGDVHGYRDELAEALAKCGLVDAEGDWAGERARLWFLGDFVDRGPDGIGVIDFVRKLQRQAADTGGSVDSLLGNHEVLLLGMHRYGDQPLDSQFGPRSFADSWELNGGLEADQEALTDDHIEWLVSRPVVAVAADHLLLHSDTLAYLEWGETPDEINDAVREVLEGDEPEQWWEVWRRLTSRHAFRGEWGASAAGLLMATLGGERIVHGHSVIAEQLGVLPEQIERPCLYADGSVLGIDAGVFVGGPCLVVELPYEPPE